LFQDNPGKPVLSQRRDLLEQPIDFYEPDALPAGAGQPIVAKHYRKTQWFGCLLFYRHGTNTPCLNSVKALKEAYKKYNSYIFLYVQNIVVLFFSGLIR